MREVTTKQYVITADQDGTLAVWDTKDLGLINIPMGETRFIGEGVNPVADDSEELSKKRTRITELLGEKPSIEPGTKTIIEIKKIVETTFEIKSNGREEVSLHLS